MRNNEKRVEVWRIKSDLMREECFAYREYSHLMSKLASGVNVRMSGCSTGDLSRLWSIIQQCDDEYYRT